MHDKQKLLEIEAKTKLGSASLGITDLLNGSFQAIIEQVYIPKDGLHRHAIISISGFLSEKSDMNSDWKHLKTICTKWQVPLFSVRWESKDTSELETLIGQSAADLGLNKLVDQWSGWQSILIPDAINSIASFATNSFQGCHDLFCKARLNAKMTGKLLAYYLTS